MWQLLVTGGYTMIPLFICSVLALAIVIEKTIILKINRVMNPRLVNAAREVHNPTGIERLLDMCSRYRGAFSNIVRCVLINRGLSKSVNQEQTELEGKIQANNLERGLVILEVIAAIAPLLGLLGTVLGLVDVFHVVAKLGVGQTAAFSSGIAKALITTVVGLVIAIPTLVTCSYFSKKVAALVLAMEREATGLINKLYG